MKMTSLNTPEAAKKKLAKRSTMDLVGDLVLAGIMYDHSEDAEARMNLATVRGWIMDEIESRDPEGYSAWLDSETDDNGLYRFVKG